MVEDDGCECEQIYCRSSPGRQTEFHQARISRLNKTRICCVILRNPVFRRLLENRNAARETKKIVMKKSLQQLVFGSLCAAILVASSTANAQPVNTVKTTKPADAKAKAADTAKDAETAKPKRDWYPFYGTVAAVDKTAKTVSLKKMEGVRLLQTDDKTTFEMNDKPASLGDVKAGNYLHGKLHKEGGKEEYILDAKIEKTAPVRGKSMGKPETEKPAVAPAPAVPAADPGTNAPAKKKKKTVTQ